MAAQIYSSDFDSRFRRHFPRRSNDFAVIVSKGHLILEEIVNRWLEALLHRPGAIEDANLRFYQKICLIRALVEVDDDLVFRMIDAAEKLNTMRNRLAHHLDYPQIEAQVRDFVSLCEEGIDPDERDEAEVAPLVRRLRRSVAFVCYAFEGMSCASHVMRYVDTHSASGRLSPDQPCWLDQVATC
jgi:hypothetical protein